MNLLVGFHIDDLDAQHGPIEHKVTSLIKDNINQSDTVHLLQIPLHSHSPPKLHVRQLLPHLLQLCEHLSYKVGTISLRINQICYDRGLTACDNLPLVIHQILS